jgi:hypothetical protein
MGFSLAIKNLVARSLALAGYKSDRISVAAQQEAPVSVSVREPSGTNVQDKSLLDQDEILFDAETLAQNNLNEAYGERPIPNGVIELLGAPDKPGSVLACFFSGRSGSMFLQSFFDRIAYPRILTVPPDSLIGFETSQFPQPEIDRFNDFARRTATGQVTRGIVAWTNATLDRCAELFDDYEGYAELRPWRASRPVFSALVQAQLAWLAPRELTHDRLLRILFLAHRLARGESLDCSRPEKLTYLWQAHVPLWDKETQWPKGMPYLPRRIWLRHAFPGMKSLTVVRFPEKALDSHLIHHAFESVQPLLATLLRRLIFDIGMAWGNDISDAHFDGSEFAVRFEDVHHHPEFVVRRICDWAGMDFDENMIATDFAFPVRGRTVSGARRLTQAEMQAKLLSYFDVLKIRFLLQENYRLWGYDEVCQPSLDASIKEYHELAKDIPFSCQALLTELGGDAVLGAQEATILQDLFKAERARRDQGIHLIPLLYDTQELRASSSRALGKRPA